METPPPDPKKLLDRWMEWEKGDIPPGELMKQFKMGGMRQLLESLVAGGEGEPTSSESGTTVGDLLDG